MVRVWIIRVSSQNRKGRIVYRVAGEQAKQASRADRYLDKQFHGQGLDYYG
jgi:hypothetical protein